MSTGILSFLSSKDKKVIPLYEKASSNLVQMSNLLVELVKTASPEKRTELYQEVARLEGISGTIAHDIFHELSVNFLTPFDKEDLHALIKSIDSVVDYVHGSVKRIQLYKIENMTPTMIKLAELTLKSCEELHKAIAELRNMKNISKIKEATVKINSIENHADDVFNTALGQLLEEEKNMIEVIKMKDILTSLETATDMCEDAASVINSILVKNA